MLLKMMKSKIHRAKVTRLDPEYGGSITIDARLMEAAGFLSGESVHVWNVNNGMRLETYALHAPRDSGEICLNGAAARLVQPGDLVIITTYCWLDEEAARDHKLKVVLVDEQNRMIGASVGGT
jgi:aspartate 1-decarboxylase